MFVKVVYSHITWSGVTHTSLTQGPYALVYEPGIWIEPKLKGSRIFVYQSLLDALNYHNRPTYKGIPYTGKTFWITEVMGAERIIPIKDAPWWMMERYWTSIAMHHNIAFSKDSAVCPWFYKWKNTPYGIYAARKVMLSHLITSEEFEKVKQGSPIYLY